MVISHANSNYISKDLKRCIDGNMVAPVENTHYFEKLKCNWETKNAKVVGWHASLLFLVLKKFGIIRIENQTLLVDLS